MIFIGCLQRSIKQRAANIDQSTFAAIPFLDWQDWEGIKVNDKNMRKGLGLRVCILEDHYGFILHYRVMEKETDDKVAIPMVVE